MLTFAQFKHVSCHVLGDIGWLEKDNLFIIYILKTFEELGVNEVIRRAIEELGFENPMPVQETVIPFLLGEDNDVIALAQTGTGKTAAYGLPLLQKIDADSKLTQAIILSPTRELCLQITEDMNSFAKYIDHVHIIPVYGGASIITQINGLRHGAQIIVATPGRLIDLMNRGEAKLDHVRNVVLDEADEMLDMGFSDSINQILEGVPEKRNTLLFSATMSKEIEKIAKTYLRDPKEIVVGSRNEGAETVNHIYYMVRAKDKYLALKRLVDYYPKIFAIIFCRTKRETQEIADKLMHEGYNADALHGDLSQQQRDLSMQKFRQHITQLLVATDVAARGLDVDDLTHVINYGLPDDVELYTHRSGRTGRAGKKGTSICIIHTKEKSKVRAIEKVIGKQFVVGTLPTPQEICTKQLFKTMNDILNTDVNEEEIAPFMEEISRTFDYIDKEDLIKKIVTKEFGSFLSYYADEPEIDTKVADRQTSSKGKGRKGGGRGRDHRRAEAGYRRLFVNLGKADGIHPGEIMQLINRNMAGHPEVGHIDILPKMSYIEVPERDANRVMKALNGVKYKGRVIRCNDADDTNRGRDRRSPRNGASSGSQNRRRGEKKQGRGKTNSDSASKQYKQDDWQSLLR